MSEVEWRLSGGRGFSLLLLLPSQPCQLLTSHPAHFCSLSCLSCCSHSSRLLLGSLYLFCHLLNLFHLHPCLIGLLGLSFLCLFFLQPPQLFCLCLCLFCLLPLALSLFLVLPLELCALVCCCFGRGCRDHGGSKLRKVFSSITSQPCMLSHTFPPLPHLPPTPADFCLLEIPSAPFLASHSFRFSPADATCYLWFIVFFCTVSCLPWLPS